MAGKNDKQRENKERHKKEMQAAKRRRQQPLLERQAPTLILRENFLIVCEGENTEPSYFKKFKLTNATIEVVGKGYNTITLVEHARALMAKGYDQVWCVLDADPKPDNPNQAANFNEAVRLGESMGIQMAFSNQAFEYWLILHFNDHQGHELERGRYNRLLNDCLREFGVVYDGESTKEVTEDLFRLLWEEAPDATGQYKSRTDRAIARAERNHQRFDDGRPPAQCESTTTVYRLVAVLKQYM